MTPRELDPTQRAFELFDEAIELPIQEWKAWVAERSDGDEGVAAEVLALLTAHAQQGGLLDRPLPSTWTSLPDEPGRGSDDIDASLESVDARIAEALAERYHEFERLGHGGMGVVFRARERKHDRAVVLKALRPEIASRHGEDRFLEEVRVASALTHPHILAFIDSGRADGLLYYVMPHVDGETLYDRLRREGPLSPEVAQPILRDVADALTYAHAHNVVHRDLKPANVLCSENHAWLMDFGIAKALHRPDSAEGLTRQGISPGTPRYMAPELLADGTQVGTPSDVFAFGQLSHEVLTGTVVSNVGSPWPAIVQRLNDEVADLPPDWGSLIGRALAADPEARPTAKELLEGLRPVAQAASTRRVRGVGLAAAVAGLAALIFVGVRASGDAPDQVPSIRDGRIAVAAFQNETGDADLDFLGRMAGDWITQGLRDLEEFAVVPWDLAQEVVERAQEPSALDPVSLLESETGAATVITGRYYRVGDQISFRADVTEAATMQVLAGINPISAPFGRPVAAIEELRDRVLGTLSARTGERTAHNESVVSGAPRLDAYRAYDSGRKYHLAQQYEQGKNAYLLAHERDTTFLPALLAALASATNVQDHRTRDSVMSYLATRRDRLSRFEDLRWQYFDAVARGDSPGALGALREAVGMTPGDRAAYNLALFANNLNRPAEGLAALQTLDPDAGQARGWAQYWTQFSHSLHLLGRHAEEVEAAASMLRRHPERTVAHALLARALAANGQLEALDEALEASALLPPRTYWSHGGALLVAGQALMAHGQAADADRYLQAAEVWLERQIVADPDYVAHRYWLANVLYSQSRWADASVVLDELMARSPSSQSYRGAAAVVASHLGDRERAWKLLEPASWPGDQANRLRYSARIAAVFGDLDRALADQSSALEIGMSGFVWHHESSHHEFALMRRDPRIQRLLLPIELGS